MKKMFHCAVLVMCVLSAHQVMAQNWQTDPVRVSALAQKDDTESELQSANARLVTEQLVLTDDYEWLTELQEDFETLGPYMNGVDYDTCEEALDAASSHLSAATDAWDTSDALYGLASSDCEDAEEMFDDGDIAAPTDIEGARDWWDLAEDFWAYAKTLLINLTLEDDCSYDFDTICGNEIEDAEEELNTAQSIIDYYSM